MELARLMKELKARMGLARAGRITWDHEVQQLSDLFTPYRGDITTKTSPGGNRLDRINGVFDSTGILAADGFTNFIKSTVWPSTNPYFAFGLPERFEKNIMMRGLADIAAKKVLRESARSNFYTAIDGWVRDDGVLGTGTLGCDELPEVAADEEGSTFGGFRFTSVPWGRVWFLVGKDGMPEFIVRDMDLPAIVAKRDFGSAGPMGEKAIADGKPYEVFRYTNLQWFNEDGIPGGIHAPLNKPWISVWVQDAGKDGLTVTREFRGTDLPSLLIARWMIVDGEAHGRGQGFIARPDMLGINKLRELVLDAAGTDMFPPTMVTDELQIDLDFGPGETILAQDGNFPKAFQTGARYDLANAIGIEDRQHVRRAFLADLIDDPEFQDRTAAAVRDRQIRGAQRLSPRADRIYNEQVVPVVEWKTNRMQAKGALRELDRLAELGVRDLDIVAISPFFIAQGEAPAVRMQGWYEQWQANAKNTGQIEILDNINGDRALNYSARVSRIPAEVMNTPEEVTAIRDQRQAALEQRQRMEQAEVAAKVSAQLPQGAPVG